MLILDLFCCGQVAAEGFVINGHKVVGIDINRHPQYVGEFIQMDIRDLDHRFLRQFDFISSSPPCQEYSRLKGLQSRYSNGDGKLIEFTRDLIRRSGVPGYIENVCQAPIAKDLVLCGCMFNKQLIRQRAFEFVNWQPFFSPPICSCNGRNSKALTIAGRSGWKVGEVHELYGTLRLRSRQEYAESIPPFYSAYVLELFEVWRNQYGSVSAL